MDTYRTKAAPQTAVVPFTLETPSRLAAKVRKIKGAELNALAQESDEATADGGFGTVIGPCWIETVDVGPYPFLRAGDAKPPWSRMLKGDMLYTFIYLRRISMPDGNTYDFDVQCEECQERYPWTLKLTDLPVKRLSQESFDRLRSQRHFEAKLSDGRRVSFNLQTIAQEDDIAALMKRQKREKATVVDILAAQTVEIEGVNTDMRAKWRFLADLDMDDLLNLQEQFEAVDCGIDTAIKTRCTNRRCRWTQDINLPLGKSFFARRRRAEKPIPEEDESQDTSDSCELSSGESPANTSGPSSPSSGGTSTGGAATAA